MLSLFRPRCPLNPGEKAWIEFRLSWLLEHFGAERLRKMETILPTGEFFPLPYRGEPAQAQAVFERVCRYMGVDPGGYRLHLFDDETDERELPPRQKHETILYESAAGEEETSGGSQAGTLHLHKGLIVDLEFLITIISRKIGQSLIESKTKLPADPQEFHHTLELTPLFFGLGIMAANSVLREKAQNFYGQHEWSMYATGGLTSRDHGYAFALISWLKEEPLPPWRNHLRRDVEDSFKASLRYLEKTGDSILDRDSPAKPYFRGRLEDWLRDAKTGTPSRRIAALWAIQDEASAVRAGEQVSIIADNLSHREPEVRKAAATAIEQIGEAASQAIPELLTASEDRHASVRSVAALAMGSMTDHAEEVLPGLLPMLNDRNVHVSNAAAWAIGQFGEKAEEAGPALVHLLRRGILRCTKDSLNDILDALLKVTKHPEEVVMETLLERDAETCQRALDLLKEHRIDAVAQES